MSQFPIYYEKVMQKEKSKSRQIVFSTKQIPHIRDFLKISALQKLSPANADKPSTSNVSGIIF